MKKIKLIIGILFLFTFCATVTAQVMYDGGFEEQGSSELDEPWWIDTDDGSVPVEATIEVDMGSGAAMEGNNCLKIVTSATGQWIAVGQDLFVEPNTDYILTFYVKADNNIAWEGNVEWAKGYMKVIDESGTALADPYVPHYWDGGEAWAPWTPGEIVFGAGFDMSIWRDYHYVFNSGANTQVYLMIGTYVNNIVTWWVDGFSVAKVEEAEVIADGSFEEQESTSLGDPWWIDTDDGSVPAGAAIEVSMSSGESIEGDNHLEWTTTAEGQWIAIGQDLAVEENTDYYIVFYAQGDAILWDDNPEWSKGYMGVTDGNGDNLGDPTVPHYCDGGELGAPWAAGEIVFGERQMMVPWRDYVYQFNSGPNTEVYMFIGTYVNRAISWRLDGFKVYKDVSGPTAVKEEAGIIPDEYALNQNYPNPFNPSTTIKFSLPEASNVELKVYDALGNIVENLAEGNYNAGVYEVNFNAQNISSGVYFYRLKTNNFLQTRKLMLLK